MKKLVQWYRGLTGPKKWLACFLLNWLYWGFIYGIVYFLVSDTPTTIRNYIFMVTFMAVFWTLVYDVFLVPRLKQRKENSEE